MANEVSPLGGKKSLKEVAKQLASEARTKRFSPFALAALLRGAIKRKEAIRGK